VGDVVSIDTLAAVALLATLLVGLPPAADAAGGSAAGRRVVIGPHVLGMEVRGVRVPDRVGPGFVFLSAGIVVRLVSHSRVTVLVSLGGGGVLPARRRTVTVLMLLALVVALGTPAGPAARTRTPGVPGRLGAMTRP
jgi:hypothetical protein